MHELKKNKEEKRIGKIIDFRNKLKNIVSKNKSKYILSTF